MIGRTMVIAGASGLVGRYCLAAGLERYDRVIALVRRPLGLPHPKLEQRSVDFERLSDLELNGDDVFCTLGAMMDKAETWEAFRHVDFDYAKVLAETSVRQGAKKFLAVTTVDANISPRWRRYTAMKRELEAAVARMPFQSVHFFRPGLLLGKREERRPIEELMAWIMIPGQIFCRGGWRRFHPIHGGVVGHAMVAAALQAGQTGTHLYEYSAMCKLAASLENAAAK